MRQWRDPRIEERRLTVAVYALVVALLALVIGPPAMRAVHSALGQVNQVLAP